MATAFFVALVLAAVGWTLVAGVATLGYFSLRDLPATVGEEPEGATPRVSIVVPARDEGPRLEQTVRGILAQRGVDLEVIVVDDRSADATPAILAAVAAEDPRLVVVRIDAVPDGWLGKCHACQVGADRATGGWLLFLDADSWLADTVVGRAVRAAAAGGADHVCLVPGLGRCTFLAQAAVAMLTLGLLGIAAGVNRDWRFAYVGVGAFTLIRRSAYDAVGGHRRVRMQVIEDFTLGYLVRRAGLRTRLYAAIPDVEVRWAHSVRSFVQVLEKNSFAKVGFSTPRAIASVLVTLALWGLPIAGAVAVAVAVTVTVTATVAVAAMSATTATPAGVAGLATPTGLAGLAAAAGMLLATVPAMLVARRHGWSLAAGLAAPLSLPLLAFATARSAWLALRQGGVRWRGTFYPLAELRAHGVEID